MSELTYTRLKEILPNHMVLAHVSYDALLTTKFSRTRSKYRNLSGNFCGGRCDAAGGCCSGFR